MEVQGDNTTEVTAQVAETKTTEQVSNSQQNTEQTTQTVEQTDLGWTEEQKSYIKGLRDENAKYRTRSKEQGSQVDVLSERLGKFETGLKTLFGEEGEKLSPEETIEALQAQNEGLAIQSALKEAAFEYGIGKDSYEYFEFLVSKRLNELGEGEEMSEEELDGIAQSAKARYASSSTSVGAGTVENPLPHVDGGAITLANFEAMTITEKSVLFQKSPDLYKSLNQQARAVITKK